MMAPPVANGVAYAVTTTHTNNRRRTPGRRRPRPSPRWLRLTRSGDTIHRFTDSPPTTPTGPRSAPHREPWAGLPPPCRPGWFTASPRLQRSRPSRFGGGTTGRRFRPRRPVRSTKRPPYKGSGSAGPRGPVPPIGGGRGRRAGRGGRPSSSSSPAATFNRKPDPATSHRPPTRPLGQAGPSDRPSRRRVSPDSSRSSSWARPVRHRRVPPRPDPPEPWPASPRARPGASRPRPVGDRARSAYRGRAQSRGRRRAFFRSAIIWAYDPRRPTSWRFSSFHRGAADRGHRRGIFASRRRARTGPVGTLLRRSAPRPSPLVIVADRAGPTSSRSPPYLPRRPSAEWLTRLTPGRRVSRSNRPWSPIRQVTASYTPNNGYFPLLSLGRLSRTVRLRGTRPGPPRLPTNCAGGTHEPGPSTTHRPAQADHPRPAPDPARGLPRRASQAGVGGAGGRRCQRGVGRSCVPCPAPSGCYWPSARTDHRGQRGGQRPAVNLPDRADWQPGPPPRSASTGNRTLGQAVVAILGRPRGPAGEIQHRP